MRILLPPSEGKTAPAAGPALELSALSFPALTGVRDQVMTALVELCRNDPDRAMQVLGLGASLAGEVERDAALQSQPCAPALQVYTGVLFSALDPQTLPGTCDMLLIASAAFGLLGAYDPIPAYRLGGAVTLPGLGSARRTWGAPLAALLDDLGGQHLLVDLRSQTYLWGRSPRTVGVRVMMLRDGRRVTVSHHNKATKGALARDLVLAGADPADTHELVDVLRCLGWDAAPAGDGIVEVLHTPASA